MSTETTPADITDRMPEIVRQSLVIVGEFLAANQFPDLSGNIVVRNGEDQLHYQFRYQQISNQNVIEGNTTNATKEEPEADNGKEAARSDPPSTPAA